MFEKFVNIIIITIPLFSSQDNIVPVNHCIIHLLHMCSLIQSYTVLNMPFQNSSCLYATDFQTTKASRIFIRNLLASITICRSGAYHYDRFTGVCSPGYFLLQTITVIYNYWIHVVSHSVAMYCLSLIKHLYKGYGRVVQMEVPRHSQIEKRQLHLLFWKVRTYYHIHSQVVFRRGYTCVSQSLYHEIIEYMCLQWNGSVRYVSNWKFLWYYARWLWK